MPNFTAHLELKTAILRVYSSGRSFEARDPFDFAAFVSGQDGLALVEGLRFENLKGDQRRAIERALADGTDFAEWGFDRYRNGAGKHRVTAPIPQRHKPAMTPESRLAWLWEFGLDELAEIECEIRKHRHRHHHSTAVAGRFAGFYTITPEGDFIVATQQLILNTPSTAPLTFLDANGSTVQGPIGTITANDPSVTVSLSVNGQAANVTLTATGIYTLTWTGVGADGSFSFSVDVTDEVVTSTAVSGSFGSFTTGTTP
jgi:hypothetical protein